MNVWPSVASVWLVLFQNTVLSDIAYSPEPFNLESSNFFKNHISLFMGLYLCVGKTSGYIAYCISYLLGSTISFRKATFNDPSAIDLSAASFFVSLLTAITLVILSAYEIVRRKFLARELAIDHHHYYAPLPTEDLLIQNSSPMLSLIPMSPAASTMSSSEIDYFPIYDDDILEASWRRHCLGRHFNKLRAYPLIFWAIIWISFWMTAFWATFLEVSPEWLDHQYGKNYSGFLWKKGLNSLLFTIFLSLTFGKWIDFCPYPYLFLLISCLAGISSVTILAYFSRQCHFLFPVILFSVSLSSGQVALGSFLTRFTPNSNIGTAYAYFKSTLNSATAAFNIIVGYIMDKEKMPFENITYLFLFLPIMTIAPFLALVFARPLLSNVRYCRAPRCKNTVLFFLILFSLQLVGTWTLFFLKNLIV
jgi:hypothetical protein